MEKTSWKREGRKKQESGEKMRGGKEELNGNEPVDPRKKSPD